jgi:RimJ/RimL family protein N-acetyltransferase
MTELTPIWQIRLRTPRLELRLPTVDELEELYRVAEAGIHPPEAMPFGVAWTDDLQHDTFIDFHKSWWREWSPTKWECNYVTFLDGRAIGTQGIGAADFPRGQVVHTGSWLGAPFQNKGYGTEQRAAVLEFAFRRLAARAAVSGALIDNIASQRVSKKLGYRLTGVSEYAPRGVAIPHYEYELGRDEWRCPFRVEIEGAEEALALFGAAS